MAEDNPTPDESTPTKKKQRLIDGDTKVAFSVAQLLTLGGSIVIICGAIASIIYFYFDTKARIGKAESSLVEVNKKLEEAAVSSDKYRKLDSDLQNLKIETQHLKESNQELRSKIFK